MKLNIFTMHQYTDTKLFYIARLETVSSELSISRIVIMDGIKNKTDAAKKLLELRKDAKKRLNYLDGA